MRGKHLGTKGKITGSGAGDNLGHCVGRCLLCWAREPAPVDRRVLSVKGAGWQEAWSKAEVRGKKGTFRFTVSNFPTPLGASIL